MWRTSTEEENYNCIMKIMNVAVCKGLGEIFKQEWDKQYGATKGTWDDTTKSGNELFKMEKTRPHAKSYLSLYQNGKRSGWDCSALFDAILYSNAIKKHLNPHVTNNIDELRKLRNELTHTFGPEHKITENEFEKAYKKVVKCLQALKLSAAGVEKIKNSFKGKLVTNFQKMACICFTMFVAGLLSCALYYYWFANPMTSKSLFRFRVLPTRPVQLVANRSRTVNAILEELCNMSIKNNRSLTYLYLSGNPGSGKSQLARLVGERYGKTSSRSWSTDGTGFVMTLKGTSLPDILQSYDEFARRLECDINNIASIRNSNKTTTMEQIQGLKTEIAKRLKEFQNIWLLIVDNVINMSEIIQFLPQLGDEDWQGGQVLITTQDMSSVPPNSSMTVHISVSKGMDPEESCEFLTGLSGLFANRNMLSKVAKELDYQPLALASAAFYVKQLRESRASLQFTWKDYLTKLEEGKRNLTELKLTKVNQAYSLTMSTAVLLAVNSFAENDLVIKHAFRFFSYVSHEAQSLEIVVNYILKVDKGKDKEDTGLRISQCSLILRSDDLKVPSISLHRIVHDCIKLYIEHDAKDKEKSREPLFVLQSLLQQKCDLGEIALIPHFKVFSAIMNIPSKFIIPRSIKGIQRIQKQIVDITSAFHQQGEFLLSKKYLVLALKFTTDRSKNNDFNCKDSLHISFPKIGEIYLNLGVIEQELGNRKKAREYLKQALNILKRQYGHSHANVAKCLTNLVNFICSNPEECDEDVMYAKELLNIDDSLKTKAILFSGLGAKYFSEHDWEQSLSHYLQAQKILQEILNVSECSTEFKQNGLKLALIRSNLGGIFHQQGDFKRAKLLLNSSILMYQSVAGRNHLGIADAYFNLGLTHFKLDDLPSAEHCFRHAREIYDQQLDPSHKKIAMVSLNLAAVLEETRQLNEAMTLYQRYGAGCRQPGAN